MEAEIVAKPQAVNPCCAVLKEKYSKLEVSRNALRQGVKIQNELIDKLQKESLNFKKELDGGKYSVFDRSVLVSNGVLHDKLLEGIGPPTDKLKNKGIDFSLWFKPENYHTDCWQCLLFISLHLFCGIINQLGPDNLDNLRKLAEQFQKQAPGAGAGAGATAAQEDDDDQVPDLVAGETFEAAAEERNLILLRPCGS